MVGPGQPQLQIQKLGLMKRLIIFIMTLAALGAMGQDYEWKYNPRSGRNWDMLRDSAWAARISMNNAYWSKLINYIYTENDSVGIGTTTPTEMLEVDGNIKGDSLDVDGFIHTKDSTFYGIKDGSYTNIDNNDVTKYRNVGYYIPYWRADFINAHYNNNDNAKLAVAGDSYSNDLYRKIKREAGLIYGYGGGYEPFYSNRAYSDFYTYCDTLKWTRGYDYDDPYNFTTSYVQSLTDADSLYIGCKAFNKLRIYYEKKSGWGKFSVKLGHSGTPDTIDTDDAAGGGWWYKDYGNLNYFDEDTIIINKVGTDTVRLYGYYFTNDFKSDVFENTPYNIEIHNIGKGGTLMRNHYNNRDSATMVTFFDTLDCSAIMMTWLDENNQGVDNMLDSLIMYLNYWRDSTDYILVPPHDNYTNIESQQKEIWYQKALDSGYAYINWKNLTGDNDDLADAGLMDAAKTSSTHFGGATGSYLSWITLGSILFPPTSKRYEASINQINVTGNSILFPNSTSIYLTEQKRTSSTGANNTMIGYNSGNDNTTGEQNVFIGTDAGVDNTTGSTNMFIGYRTGYVNTTGNNNSFIGAYAGTANTEGVENTFIGRSAGVSNTTGNYNTAIGAYALEDVTTNTFNVAIGYAAGRNNDSQQGVYIGQSAGQDATGNYNNVIGANAGSKGATGNTAIGHLANRYSTGSYNVAIGYGAAQGTNGSSTYGYNIAMGYLTGYVLRTSQYNVMIGSRAGYQTTTGGGGNVFIGKEAGYSNVSGANSVFIGPSAGYNETASNKLYIENSNSATPLIYGEFDNDTVVINGDLAATGNFKMACSTSNITTPPTDTEIDGIFGTPATVGAGFMGMIDDNGDGSDFYLVRSDGTNWWYFTGTKAVDP